MIGVAYPHPVRQVVGVGVGVVGEAAVLDDQFAGVRRVAAGVPAERRGAGEIGEDGDRFGHMCPFGVLADQLVGLPAQSVAGDLVAEFEKGGDGFRIALHGAGDREDRQR